MKRLIISLSKSFLLLAIATSITIFSVNNTQAALFNVDSTADSPDAAINGVCDIGGGDCTLRAALQEANAAAGPHFININITGTIVLGSALPAIIQQVSISGTTSPGYSNPTAANQGGANPAPFTHNLGVTIQGPNNATDILFFDTGSDNSSVTALAFVTYDQAIVINGVDGTSILQNFFGMDHTETIGGTQNTAVIVENGADMTAIGLDEGGNIMVNHDNHAVIVTSGSTNTSIQDNNIGIGKDSSTLLVVGDRNAMHGVFLTGASSGTTLDSNRICSNGNDGVNVDLAVLNTTATRNIFGAGLLDVPRGNVNNGFSLNLSGASNDQIGTDGDGVDDALEGNTIVDNGGHGIDIAAGSTGTPIIAGNYIGETRSGTDLGNTGNGIDVSGDVGRIGSDDNGTSDTEEGNFINNNAIGIIIYDGADDWIIRDNTIDDNSIRGIQHGITGAPAGPNNTVIDRNTISNHGPGAGTNGVGIENGAYSSFTRNTLLGNRVGFSIDFYNGATATIGGATPADGNDFSGASENGVELLNSNTSAANIHNNTFGANAANLKNLSLQGQNASVGGPGFGNTFYEPQAGGLHIEIIGVAADGNTIDDENSFEQPAVAPFFMAIDLFGNGPSGIQGVYPNAGDPNLAIDPPENIAQTIGTLTVTGTSRPNADIRAYTSPTIDQGIAENYLTTFSANGAGDWSVDLTGMANNGDIVTFSQTETANGDTSEFSGIQLAGSSGGGRRRAFDENFLVTNDYSAPLLEPSKLIQGIDFDNSTPFESISFRSIDYPPVEVFQVPIEHQEGIRFIISSWLDSLKTFFVANLLSPVANTQISIPFKGPGSLDYFIPQEAGEYKFEAYAQHGTGNDTQGTFTVTVEPLKQAATDCSQYDELNLYLNDLLGVEIAYPEFNTEIDAITSELGSRFVNQACRKPIIKELPELTCPPVDEDIADYYQDNINIFTSKVQSIKDIEGFDDDSELSSLLEDFDDAVKEEQNMLIARYDAFINRACFDYNYYDFPGEKRFGADGFKNVLLIHEMRNIFSGLITDELLGSYLNLIRSHAIIATSRTFNDDRGVFYLLFDEKALNSFHNDVDEFDEYKEVYEQYAKGYNLEQAATAAIELDFVSEADIEYLISILQQRVDSNQEDQGRYLLPTSDIQRIDLLALLDSALHLSTIFPPEEINLTLPSDLNSLEYRKIIATFLELGLIQNTSNLNQGIPRGEAFTLFYRIQQLNRMLREKLDESGFAVNESLEPTINQQVLTKPELLAFTKYIIEESFNGKNDFSLILETRTRSSVNDFWDSWNEFTEYREAPFPQLIEFLFASKNPFTILENLKDLLD